MDSTQPTEQQNFSQNNAVKKKLVLRIFFTVIIIILLTVILNYFNILKLSEIFPQLGLLPRKEVPTGTSQSNNITRSRPARQSFPTFPPSPTINQVKEMFTQILPNILNQSLFPQSSSDINLIENKGIKQIFSATWDSKDGKAITIFTISPDGKEISELLLFFPYQTTSSISTEFAQSITPKLLSITPKGKWACKTISNTANYCENFWEEQNGARRGIALKESIPLSQAKKISISFCEHSQKSKLYSWKSCKPEFLKTGVK